MINKDLLYDKPTHMHPVYGPVKVFINTVGIGSDGGFWVSAEIMETGKWTTVLNKDLRIYYDH